MEKIKQTLAHAATILVTAGVSILSLADAFTKFAEMGNTDTEIAVGLTAMILTVLGIYHRITGK